MSKAIRFITLEVAWHHPGHLHHQHLFRGLWKSEIQWYHAFYTSEASSLVSITEKKLCANCQWSISVRKIQLEIVKSQLYCGLKENDNSCVKWPKKYLDRFPDTFYPHLDTRNVKIGSQTKKLWNIVVFIYDLSWFGVNH